MSKRSRRGRKGRGAQVALRSAVPRVARRTATRVRGGRTSPGDRPETSPTWGGTQHRGVWIERDRPGDGFRHVLRKADVMRFIDVLPDWDDLRNGIDAIVIAAGWPDCFGWYEPGMVAIGAWPRSRQIILDDEWVAESRPVLDRLAVPMERIPYDRWRLEFDDRAARGFLLLDVLLHELGHHHDRMDTRSRRDCARGEPYAMEYAERRAEEIWPAYVAAFGD